MSILEAVSSLRSVLTAASGLALFLLGIRLVSLAVRHAGERRIRRHFESLRPRKGGEWIGLGVGALVTGLFQSSSLVTAMLMGMVHSGMLSYEQAVGLVLGANVGTTFTVQLISLPHRLPLEWIALGGVFCGAMGLATGSKRLGLAGFLATGFGSVLLGFELMGEGIRLLSSSGLIPSLSSFGGNTVKAIAAGGLLAGVIQSSSASMAILVSSARSGLVDLPTALGFMLGTNIGTCSDSLILGIITGREARRLALFNFVFNLAGALVFIPLLGPFEALVRLTSSDVGNQLANAHTAFNGMTAVGAVPFLEGINRVMYRLLPRGNSRPP